MAKIADNAAEELPLNDERLEVRKHNSHTAIALRDMIAQRDKALATFRKSEAEVAKLNAAIEALS